MRIKTTIVLLMLFQLMTTMTMAMVLSIAPAMGAFFNIEIALVPYLNIGFVVSGMLVPIFGYYADKQGVKKILVLGAFLFSLGTLLTAFAKSPSIYFFTRMLIGIGHNVFFALVANYASRLVEPRLFIKLSGYFKLAFASGIFIAPIMGALVVSTIGFQNYYLSVFAITMLLALILTRIPHVENVSSSPITLADFKALFKYPFVWWMMAMTFLVFLAPNTIYTFLSIYLSSVGQTQQQISLIYTITGVGAVLSGFVILFLGHRYSLRDLLRYGVMGVIFTLIFIFPLNAWILVPALLVFSLALDLVVGVLFPVASTMPVKNPASLTATLSLTMSVTALVTSLINPLLFERFGFQFLLGMVGISVTLGYFAMRKGLSAIELHENR